MNTVAGITGFNLYGLDANPPRPFVATLRGTRGPDYTLTSNTITKTIGGDIKHYNLATINYNAITQLLKKDNNGHCYEF